MEFCPSCDFGEGGDVGEESEQDEGEDGGARMGDSVFGAGIGDFFDATNEEGEGIGSDIGLGHGDLREGERGLLDIVYYVEWGGV